MPRRPQPRQPRLLCLVSYEPDYEHRHHGPGDKARGERCQAPPGLLTYRSRWAVSRGNDNRVLSQISTFVILLLRNRVVALVSGVRKPPVFRRNTWSSTKRSTKPSPRPPRSSRRCALTRLARPPRAPSGTSAICSTM